MKATLSADGLLEIPELLREADSIGEGSCFEIERLGRGEYRLTLEEAADETSETWLDVLLSCPERGWYESEVPAQNTDAIDGTRFE